MAVDQGGDRIYDRSINRLTIIASESFEQYAAGLQGKWKKKLAVVSSSGGCLRLRLPSFSPRKRINPLGRRRPNAFWLALVENGFLDEHGDLTDKFAPEEPGFALALPSEFQALELSVIEEMKRYTFKNRVANARERRKLKFNKRIELNEDFQALWERINKKTRYSVEFSTQELIAKAVEKIKKMEPIQPLSIFVDKQELEISVAGLEGGRISDSRTIFVRTHSRLPDILAFLQRENRADPRHVG